MDSIIYAFLFVLQIIGCDIINIENFNVKFT